MLLRLFKGTGPGVIFLIVATLAAVWLSAFLIPRMDSIYQYDTDPMPLYALLQTLLGGSHLLGVLFSFSLVSLLSFLLVYFNTSVFFINERTFLPALIYILFGGLFPETQELNPVLPASVFLMIAIIRIMDGYRKPGTAYNFFDAGILISMGSLFYANLIWFGILVIIGIALLRTGNLVEIAISILGLITPYLLVFGVYYVIGKDLPVLLSLVGNNLFSRSAGYNFDRLTIVTLVFTGMIVLVSIVYLFMLLNAKKVKTRQTFSLLIWGFLISLAAYIVLPSVSVEIFWIMSIPVSYFLTHYFVFAKKKLVPEIFFSVLIILILLIQIFYIW
jgi:hypothetical protein